MDLLGLHHFLTMTTLFLPPHENRVRRQTTCTKQSQDSNLIQPKRIVQTIVTAEKGERMLCRCFILQHTSQDLNARCSAVVVARITVRK